MFSLLVQAHKLTKLDGNGDAELDSYLAMPGNTSTGTLWNPPDTEDADGCGYDNSIDQKNACVTTGA